MWFYFTVLERCDDILSLTSPNSVSQRNPSIIWSWEEGNFAFNGDKRTNFLGFLLNHNFFFFASSGTLARSQTKNAVSASLSPALIFTAGPHRHLTFGPCSSTTPRCFSEVLLRQLFSIHKKIIDHKVFNSIQLAWHWEFYFAFWSAKCYTCVLSNFISWISDLLSSLTDHAELLILAVKVLVIWPHKLNSMPLGPLSELLTEIWNSNCTVMHPLKVDL